MKRYLPILFLLLTMLTAACAGDEHDHAGDGTTYTCPMHPQIVQDGPGTCPICGMDLVPVSASGGENGQLMLSESQMALANIAVAPVSYGAIGGGTILTGRLVLDETQTEVVSSRVQGRIERLYVKETGTTVKKGQPLYELYSEQLLTLEREYSLALRQHEELGQEEPRFASFLETAKKKLLLYGLTENQIRNMARSGRLDARVTFLAPAAGVVTEVATSEGQYISEGGLLYRLGKLGTVWVEAELFPQEIAKVNLGDSVKVTVQGLEREPIWAAVSFLAPEFRQGSQVAVLRAEIPNPEKNFIPGMQASVTVPSPHGSRLTVPTDAVIRDQRGSHVWVQSGENTFEPRLVTLGEESPERVAVLSGLRENDKVVVSGAYLLHSEVVLKKGTDPMAGHNH